MGQININGLGNKFGSLQMLIKANINIFVITETKIDETFPSSQFAIGRKDMPFLTHGVVVSMFDFHRSDRGLNPGRGSKIS